LLRTLFSIEKHETQALEQVCKKNSQDVFFNVKIQAQWSKIFI